MRGYFLPGVYSTNILFVNASPEVKARVRAERLRAAEKAVSGVGGNNASLASNSGRGVGGDNLIHPNMNLTLDIGGRNQEDALLIQGLCAIQSKDDHGRALRTQMDPYPAERIFFPRPEQEEHRRATIALLREPDARSIKLLEGELVVVNGVVRTLEFSANELHPGASKRLCQVSATLNTIQQINHGVTLDVTCIAMQFEPRDPVSLQENLEQMTLGRRAIQAEFIGTDGITYKSNGASVSSHRERPLTVGADGVARRDGAVPSLSTVTSHLTFSFSSIPEGVQPQKVILRVVEQQGENFRVPFKFTDIPLADPL